MVNPNKDGRYKNPDELTAEEQLWLTPIKMVDTRLTAESWGGYRLWLTPIKMVDTRVLIVLLIKMSCG